MGACQCADTGANTDADICGLGQTAHQFILPSIQQQPWKSKQPRLAHGCDDTKAMPTERNLVPTLTESLVAKVVVVVPKPSHT